MITILFILFGSIYVVHCGHAVFKTDLNKVRGSRIVGGENATIEEFPFQVSLHLFHTHVCGGSIISERWIVTAAHCTTLNYGYSHTPIRGFTVRVGATVLETGGEEICVLRVYDHPSYLLSFPQGFDYDISLLYLEKDLTFTRTVQPIRLPDVGEVYPNGTNATVIGWGVNEETSFNLQEILQKVDVPLITNEECETRYNMWNIFNYITDRMICAGYEEGKRDACGGDSGGPLITNNTLVGVVSWGNGCARENAPGVYADVQYFREWIREVTSL